MSFESKRFQLAILVVLVVAMSYIVFYHLGKKPLLDYDESIYAQVARQAYESRHQLGFTWYGNLGLNRTELWFEKPPLMIWLTESAYWVFGVNEFAARFWPAIFGLLTMVLTFFFVKNISKSFYAAVFATSVFFIAFQYIYNLGVLQFDVPVGFFILLTLYAFWLAKANGKFYFLFWLSLGLGVLTKSVIGLLPLPVVLVYSILARDFAYLKSKLFYMAGLVFIVTILPWHIVESIKYGKGFWQQYLFYHVFDRYSSGLEGNGKPFSFYWNILAEHRIMFRSLIVSLVYCAFKSFKDKNYFFPLAALLCIFIFFSTASTKLPAYILVIFPYIASVIGMAFADFAGLLERYHKVLGGLFVFFVVVVFMFFGYKFNHFKLTKEKEQYVLDSRAVGAFLKSRYLDESLYYYSTIGTKPSIIFYSNRVVYYLPYPSPKPKEKLILVSEISPDFKNQTVLFSTSTQKVYQIQ